MTEAVEITPQEQITSAYFYLTDHRRDVWVALAQLRETMGTHTPREAIDAALRDMDGQNGVVLIPEENQKTIRPEDREAALYIGGEAQHLINFQ
jgi:hypothetical protein